MKTILITTNLLFFISCAGNWTQLTQPITLEGTKEHFKNLKLKHKKPNDISDSPSFDDPLGHIRLFKLNEKFSPNDFKCTFVQDVQIESETDLLINKKNFDYAIERLILQTDKLEGNAVQIDKVEINKMNGKVFRCDSKLLGK